MLKIESRSPTVNGLGKKQWNMKSWEGYQGAVRVGHVELPNHEENLWKVSFSSSNMSGISARRHQWISDKLQLAPLNLVVSSESNA